jgi:hypothetical protein
METIKLTFGTASCVNFSMAKTQNKYDNLYKIVMEENAYKSYSIHIMDGEDAESAFPVFKVDRTSFFKFRHGDKESPPLVVHAGRRISSFPLDGKVYGLEVLNERKQKSFESKGGHDHKTLTVWFGVAEQPERVVEYDCMLQCDGPCAPATVALNNTSTQKFVPSEYTVPKVMHKATFTFCFEKPQQMMDNLYLS